jgi:hypothetical protein
MTSFAWVFAPAKFVFDQVFGARLQRRGETQRQVARGVDDALRVIVEKVEKRPHNMLLDPPSDLTVLPDMRAVPRLQDCHLEESAKHITRFQSALTGLAGSKGSTLVDRLSWSESKTAAGVSLRPTYRAYRNSVSKGARPSASVHLGDLRAEE